MIIRVENKSCHFQETIKSQRVSGPPSSPPVAKKSATPEPIPSSRTKSPLPMPTSAMMSQITPKRMSERPNM